MRLRIYARRLAPLALLVALFGIGTGISAPPMSAEGREAPLVAATKEVSHGILNTPRFLPSALKFHYQFNLNGTNSIFQSLLNSTFGIYRGSHHLAWDSCNLINNGRSTI